MGVGVGVGVGGVLLGVNSHSNTKCITFPSFQVGVISTSPFYSLVARLTPSFQSKVITERLQVVKYSSSRARAQDRSVCDGGEQPHFLWVQIGINSDQRRH